MKTSQQRGISSSTNSDSYYLSDGDYDEEMFPPRKKKTQRKSKPKRVARFIKNPPIPNLPIVNESIPIVAAPERKKNVVKTFSIPNEREIKQYAVIVPQPMPVPAKYTPSPQMVTNRFVPSCFDVIPRGTCPGINVVTNELFFFV